MKYLIDTHTFLWHLNGAIQLSPAARKILDNPKNENFISQASLIELSIKLNLGKLELLSNWDDLFFYFENANWGILPITNADIVLLSSLPLHHGDPFDRLLICQAQVQNIAIVSKDATFDRYGINRIWKTQRSKIQNPTAD